ncbi:CWF19-like protein 1 homolog isoform X1 [Drosophila sulfurigaster albostrigata]|uniref:CWF19-like protein 1 homolog isoform X1 n=1 Tax=Drosophila sulfurigaster albostrigata TaxID=89887 RepID=UPI002D21E21E|nr:CWF19-like protein 1 homolog isoform X1 [Drosophila sulfurigaster albostrigata]
MDASTKILVVGDVRGRFKQLFSRVEQVNKKAGPFEILCCVGDFFGADKQNEELIAYKNGFKHITVPTYILGANKEEDNNYFEDLTDGEICTNLTYLGKRGVYTLSSGVKIAYLSGVEAATSAAGDHEFSKADVQAVRNSCLVSKSCATDYRGVDVLLTSQWPYGLQEKQNANASKLISFLSREIKPRYHFCGINGTFYECAPFRVPKDETTQFELCTRFISLADVGNAEKAKYIYALSLKPVDKTRLLDLVQKTTDEIPCPYIDLDMSGVVKKNETSESQQYFFDMDSSGNRKRRGEAGQRDKRPRIMQIDQDNCWFCLSSIKVEKHLIITVGERFYIALAKGPINSHHVLILSTKHIPCSAQLSPEDWEELEKFKGALRQLFKSLGQVVCFTERHYKTSHLIIDVLAFEEGYAWKIKHSFEDKAEEFNLEFETLPALDSPKMLPEMGPYFVAELPDDSTLITRQMKHFPLHFARDVFCSENLLNCDEKVNWKECLLEKEEETAYVEEFRKSFAPFDFTDDD